ncbi:MAG: anthranilate synthase component I, partial [Rhodobacteraceae bacterium]|nr:anthranilate synthase component I [Paracoccaceae bacterium]
MTDHRFVTEGGVEIARRETATDYATAIEALIDRLDDHCGVLLSSNYEYPGRYTRWDIGLAEPPLMIESRGLYMVIKALNARGEVLLGFIRPAISALDAVEELADAEGALTLTIRKPERLFNEEERSRAPSVFSVLRAIVDLFRSEEDSNLGLYG